MQEESNNLNITPDMISNWAGMLKNSNIFNNSSSETQENTEKNNTNSNTNSENFTSSIDIETIMKMKTIMEALNKNNDPRSNLLYSLKPYLRESRQKKIDQYVNLFKITSITNLFKNEKGDEIIIILNQIHIKMNQNLKKKAKKIILKVIQTRTAFSNYLV